MHKVRRRIAAVLYIILSLAALLLWMALIFGSAFGPAPPPPGVTYESTVSFGDVGGIMTLGLLGAVLGIVAGIKGLTAKPAGKILLLCAPLIGVIGSVAFFLMDDLEWAGVLAFLISVLPTLVYLPLRGRLTPKR